MTIISTLLMTHPHKGIGMWLPLQSSFFLGLGLAGLILGCGGAPSPEDANSRGSTQRHGWPQSTAGRVAITLVNEGDSAEVASVNLHITGVEVRAAFSPWIDLPLGALAKTAVLMADPLEPLVEAGVLPEGAYQEVKFRLGDQHSFMDRNGVTHALLAPAELVCHRAGLTVKGGSSANLAFLVDAASAIRERPAGSGRFKLEAHALMARNLGQTGSISGSVRLDGTHAPLAGATVTAQALQPGSAPFRVLRTTQTRADGSYTLDLLPQGSSYRVLVQAYPGTSTFESAVSTGLHLTPPASLHLDFQPLPRSSPQVGKLVVSSFPGLDPAFNFGEINVRQSFSQGVNQAPLELVVARHRVTGNGPFEFPSLPVGTYTVTFRYESWTPGGAQHLPSQEEKLSKRITVSANQTVFVH